MEKRVTYPLWECLAPFVVSISLLLTGSMWELIGSHAYYTPCCLLAGGLTATIIARFRKVSWKAIQCGIMANVKPILPTFAFLLLIRTLAVSWLLGGIIPSGIYFGIKYLNPALFLVLAALFSGLMALVCGSSWLTVGTMGVIFLGIGNALGFPPPLVAGAVISGAYFGDKLTPLSETTVLAASMTKTPLYRHVYYMLWTSAPTFLITLGIFGAWSFVYEGGSTDESYSILKALEESFDIRLSWLLVPLLVLFLTLCRVSPTKTLVFGALAGYAVAFWGQKPLLTRMIHGEHLYIWQGIRLLSYKTFWGVQDLLAQNLLVSKTLVDMNERLVSDGLWGMLDTIWVIISSMVLSGAMEGAGMLDSLIARISHIKSRKALIVLTTFTAIFFNITVADQYLAIILTSKMFAKMFAKQGLASENTSRAIEDAATVTSPLVAWNTCGMAQATALNIATRDYLPYCYFNLLSPLVSIAYMWGDIGIATTKTKQIRGRACAQ